MCSNVFTSLSPCLFIVSFVENRAEQGTIQLSKDNCMVKTGQDTASLTSSCVFNRIMAMIREYLHNPGHHQAKDSP
jgi:hypothetical protein